MEELKKHYNELLKRFYNGSQMVADCKDDKEKETEYLELLKNIQLEMNDTLMKIGDYTEEETTNGFKFEEKPAIEPEIKKETQIIVHDINHEAEPPTVMNTMEEYKNNWNMAVQLSKSDLVPDAYKNKPENVIIALGIAQQTGIQPFTIMQNLNIVRGRASFSGSFCRTLIEKTGKYLSLDIKYIGEQGKDTYGAYLEATKKDGSIVKGPEVTIAMAKAEGWLKNTKWQTMPQLMLGYRATAFFARLYEPSALNGVYTDDELEDVYNTPKEVKDVL